MALVPGTNDCATPVRRAKESRGKLGNRGVAEESVMVVARCFEELESRFIPEPLNMNKNHRKRETGKQKPLQDLSSRAAKLSPEMAMAKR